MKVNNINAIEITNLRKTYRGKTPKEVLKGMNLTIKKGEFIGILGSNGAGKTTTINCITGVSEPTEGSIKVSGLDVVSDYKQARAEIGLSPQEFTIDIFQSVYEILYFQGGLFGLDIQTRKDRAEEMIRLFELEPHRDKKFMTLSGGLKRRTIVGKALIHDPKILILDEPTAGVDVETRQSLWKYLKEIHAKGKTIILTSHYLEEVQELCDRVVIIKSGDIVYDETMAVATEGGKLEQKYLEIIGR
jgi:ABC-2 type transport system ATP-binding protein